jgi:sugar transferase (PEP-CTERM system associated)
VNGIRNAYFQALDALCILVALYVSGEIMLPAEYNVLVDYTGASTFTTFFFLLFFYVLDCYNVGHEDVRDSIARVSVASVLGIIFTGFTFYSFEHWRFERTTFVVLLLLVVGMTLLWRMVYHRFGQRFTTRPRVVLVGVDRAGRVRKLLNEGMPEAEILGYVGEGDVDPDAGPCLGAPYEPVEIARRYGATMLVMLPDAPVDEDIARDLLDAKLRGLMVVDIRTLYEHVAKRIPVDQIRDEWLLTEDGFNLNTQGSVRRLKRAFDVIVSLSLLITTAPIMLVAAIAIRMESPGPVIYRQKRVGINEQEFMVLKFRSMRTDAEKDGAVWATKGDSRVTRVGRFIRKVRIDELPQLWNVLRGDMSMIGPRPERMEFVRQLEKVIPYFYVRHSVKPGITGWAQVCYPYGASVEDARYKLEYDLYYIKNMSPLLDIQIVLKTVGVILFPKGAR